MSKVNFSADQRALIINQFKIIAELKKIGNDLESSKIYDKAADALIYGVSTDWAFEGTHLQEYRPVQINDEADETFVIETLNMYDFIYSVYNSLDSKEKKTISKNDLRFAGFDGNSNDGRLGFYRFVTEDLGRFETVTKFIKENKWDENSHGFGLELPDMVKRFQETRGKKMQDVDRLKYIIQAD